MAKKEMIKNGEDISLDDGNVLVLNGVSVAEKSTEVKKELEAEKEPERRSNFIKTYYSYNSSK